MPPFAKAPVPLIDISLLLPTRGRVQRAREAVESAVGTADQPTRLELALYVDEDDEPSHALEFPQLSTIKLIRERAKMGAVTRALAEVATGRYLMLANDDLAFRTPGWDTAVLESFARHPDDIGLVWGNDLCGGAPAHPFVSRVAVEWMGQICPEEYHREYIDTHLFDIFRKLRELGHDRLMPLSDVVIEHLSFFAGKSPVDATYHKPRHWDDERRYIDWRDERDFAAAQLVKGILSRARLA